MFGKTREQKKEQEPVGAKKKKSGNEKPEDRWPAGTGVNGKKMGFRPTNWNAENAKILNRKNPCGGKEQPLQDTQSGARD